MTVRALSNVPLVKAGTPARSMTAAAGFGASAVQAEGEEDG